MQIKRNIFYIAAILMVAIMFYFSSVTARAVNTTSYGVARVDHVAGILEKVNEKVSMLLKFNNDDKASYYQELLNKRLGEVDYVIRTGQGDKIEETTTRYNAYLGNFGDFVVKNKIKNKKDSALTQFEEHSKAFEELQKKVPVDSGFWILIQHNINSIKIFKDNILQV